MTTLFTDITAAAVDWSRAQFALTAIYHWLFVPLTLGLAVVMGIMETIYYRSQRSAATSDARAKAGFWRHTTQFWQRLFGVNFAMGVATGIILEFEFGTNWSNYSWFVGDIFGAPLAIEGIVAFFMESTFVAVMFFGWKKVSAGFHLASTWLTGLGATFSAWWILVANSWMQYPVGCTFNPDTMRNEMASFADVALSPFAIDKFCHTVTSSWIIGALFVVAVSGWYLLKGRHRDMSLASIRIAGAVGLVAALLAAMTGDNSAYMVAKTQPMKLAAMEALYNGGEDQALTAVAWVNPFEQPDFEGDEEPELRVAIPGMLSLLATRDAHGFVPGINDLLDGYTAPDGTEHLAVEEKMECGRTAIAALAAYRQAKADGNEAEAAAQLPLVTANMPYFGYGYIREPHEVVPYIPVCFWAFRVMVGLGCLFILFFAVTTFYAYRKTDLPRWLCRAALAILPLGWVASEMGWVVAEMGRQPWTIQDMLPTWAAVSNLTSGYIATTFAIFLVLFTTLLVVEINIMLKQIQKH